MATPSFQSLTPAQKRMAMAKYHARQDAKTSLTPDQAKKAALAQVVAPGLTRGQLNQTVAADTGLRYGSTEKDLRAQPGRINSAFAAYKQAIANASNNLTGSGDQVGGSYGGAVQQVKNLQSGLDQTAKDQWAGQQQAMAADAASRGATADPRLADVAHNASNVRDILTGSYGAMLLGQGANARQGFVDRGVNAEQQRGEQQSGVRANLQKLLAEKGAFKVSDSQQLISNTFSNALKQALEKSQVAQAGATTAGTKAKTGLTKATTAFLQKYNRLPSTADPNSPAAKLDAARLDFFNTHHYFPPTGPPKPANSTGKDQFGNTKAQRESYRNSWDRAKSGASLIGASGDTVQSLTQLLIAKYPTIPPWMATAAAQQHVLGYVGPNFVHRLVQHGVSKGYATHKPPAPKVPSAPVIPGISQVTGS